MGRSCIYNPVDKNGNVYKELPKYRSEYGQQVGSLAFLKALSPSFQERHKGKLEIDDQGVATLETASRMPDMRKLIGTEKMKESLANKYNFREVTNNSDNFNMLLEEAKTFNDKESGYIAYPEFFEGGIRNVIHESNSDTVKAFNDMYGCKILNERLMNIFGSLGITVGELYESESGYTGVVDFSKAKDIANGFAELIRIANGMQGQMALSEEFSHIVIRALRNQTLMQRILNNLQSNSGRMQEILGDSYDNYVNEATDEEGNVDYERVAEECVGRMLQKSLINEVQEAPKNYFERLFERIVNYLKQVFRKFDENEVQKAMLDADQTIDTLAKNLLEGNAEIKKEDILDTFSDERMYHLEDSVNALTNIIQNAINTELKKSKIVKTEKGSKITQQRIKNLEAILRQSPEGKLKGLINYANSAVYDLGNARKSLKDLGTSKEDFAKLRGIKSTIQSYNDFIKQLAELLNDEDSEFQKLLEETSIEDKHHVKKVLHDVYTELASLKDLVENRYKKTALKSIEEFFKPFFDVNGKFNDGSHPNITLKTLLEVAEKDIGFFDKYFLTMSSSGDVLLQLFDDVVDYAKAEARQNTIDEVNEIIQLMLDAEEAGITDFEWMFERDSDGNKTGNYISAVNIGQFVKDKNEFLEQLEKEYGANPTGAKAKEKLTKRAAWMSRYSKFYGAQPNPSEYHNTEFDKLSLDPKKLEFLDKFMALKQKMDSRLPSTKVSSFKAIQMRRTAQQKFINTISNPENVFENVKESLRKEFGVTEDDENEYGVVTGLRSFDGSEFKVLPVPYTERLRNPEELSNDVFSALAAYSYSTNLYQEMDKVVDPLEVARGYIKEFRKHKSKKGGKNMVEKLSSKISNIIYGDEKGNYMEKLDFFMNSQVYQRYYADSDDTFKVFGKNIRKNKLINSWLKLTSTVQLGFNWPANAGNIATGIGMQNIEALCGHYFNGAELFNADGAYLSEIVPYLMQLESRNPTNKLALFDRMFDIKQEFKRNNRELMNKLYEKTMGKSWAFLGQNCGDHWLYNRTAIAICMRQKVISKGKEMTLWEALQVVDAFEGDSRVKKLVIDAVDAETGEVIDRRYIARLSRKINKINHRLFGVYNSDDMVAAQSVAFGRCVMQYRQWIAPMFARRFQGRKYISALNEWEEGYYITTLRLISGLRNGIEGWKEVWADLDDEQKKNLWRTIVEVMQFAAISAVVSFVNFGKDDPDRLWILKFAEYMAQREKHELGNLTPSLTMGSEILKTVKSPAALLNTTQAALNLLSSLLNPFEWNDTIESGKYKGMSTLHKNLLKAPIPIISPFNQLERFIDIEESTKYYARSY